MNNLIILIDLRSVLEEGICGESSTEIPRFSLKRRRLSIGDLAQVAVDGVNTTELSTSPTQGVEIPLTHLKSQSSFGISLLLSLSQFLFL